MNPTLGNIGEEKHQVSRNGRRRRGKKKEEEKEEGGSISISTTSNANLVASPSRKPPMLRTQHRIPSQIHRSDQVTRQKVESEKKVHATRKDNHESNIENHSPNSRQVLQDMETEVENLEDQYCLLLLRMNKLRLANGMNPLSTHGVQVKYEQMSREKVDQTNVENENSINNNSSHKRRKNRKKKKNKHNAATALQGEQQQQEEQKEQKEQKEEQKEKEKHMDKKREKSNVGRKSRKNENAGEVNDVLYNTSEESKENKDGNGTDERRDSLRENVFYVSPDNNTHYYAKRAWDSKDSLFSIAASEYASTLSLRAFDEQSDAKTSENLNGLSDRDIRGHTNHSHSQSYSQNHHHHRHRSSHHNDTTNSSRNNNNNNQNNNHKNNDDNHTPRNRKNKRKSRKSVLSTDSTSQNNVPRQRNGNSSGNLSAKHQAKKSRRDAKTSKEEELNSVVQHSALLHKWASFASRGTVQLILAIGRTLSGMLGVDMVLYYRVVNTMKEPHVQGLGPKHKFLEPLSSKRAGLLSKVIRERSILVLDHPSEHEEYHSASHDGVAYTKRTNLPNNNNSNNSNGEAGTKLPTPLHTLHLPIKDGSDSVIGVVEFIRFAFSRPFSASETKQLKYCENIVDTCMDTAMMYDLLKRLTRKAMALVEVADILKQNDLEFDVVLKQIMDTFEKKIGADRCSLFMVDNVRGELWSYVSSGLKTEIRFSMSEGIAGYVARTGEALNIEDAYLDPRFNPTFDKKTGYRTKAVLCMPIYNSHGQIVGVAMMINSTRSLGVFDEDDIELLEMCCKHIGISMYTHELFEATNKFQRQSEIMHDISRALSLEMETRPLFRTIMEKLNVLVDCDRCNVFVADYDKQELWSMLFKTSDDMTSENISPGGDSGSDGRMTPDTTQQQQQQQQQQQSNGTSRCSSITHRRHNSKHATLTRSISDTIGKSECKFRIPLNKGIAGYVVTSGNVVNVTNAYQDHRFNREVDKLTGYHTKTILCVPIRSPHGSKVIGCLQMINKKEGVFDSDDENILNAFAAHIGITLQNICAYDEAIEAQRRQYSLLRRMLPAHIVDKLQGGETYIAEPHENLYVLFSDIVGFTAMSARITPQQLVGLLNKIFGMFDKLTDKYNVYKVETIGDAYMVVAGLPFTRNPNPGIAIVEMARDMQTCMQSVMDPTGHKVQVRIGINFGCAVAGTVGEKMPRFCFFGDTINTASRMESTGVPGCIQISPSVYECVNQYYVLEKRGTIPVKGKGEMETYLVSDRKPDMNIGDYIFKLPSMDSQDSITCSLADHRDVAGTNDSEVHTKRNHAENHSNEETYYLRNIDNSDSDDDMKIKPSPRGTPPTVATTNCIPPMSPVALSKVSLRRPSYGSDIPREYVQNELDDETTIALTNHPSTANDDTSVSLVYKINQGENPNQLDLPDIE